MKILQEKADQTNQLRGFYEDDYYESWDQKNEDQFLSTQKNLKENIEGISDKDLKIDIDDKVNTFGHLNIGL